MVQGSLGLTRLNAVAGLANWPIVPLAALDDQSPELLL